MPNGNFDRLEFPVLPIQIENSKPLTSEQRLCLAILENALIDYLKNLPFKNSKVFITTRAWFNDDDESWPFSFIRVCQFLSLDPSYIRRSLNKQTTQLRPKELYHIRNS